MFCAARGAVRNAKQKKTVPAKNSEAIFWRPRFTRPLRAGKRANANFACSEGFFCVRCAAPSAGAASFAKPAAVWTVGFCARCPGVCSLLQPGRLCVRFAAGGPAFCIFVPGPRALLPAASCAWSACLVFFRFCEGFHACRLFARSVCCLCGFFLSIFALFCLTSSSQKSFPLSLRPRRASTFFRKESRQRFARGVAPSNPIPAPCGQSISFPRCWPAYAAFQAANRRLTGKRLKSQGAELSFSSVSVRRGTSVPFRQSPPFSRCWPA